MADHTYANPPRLATTCAAVANSGPRWLTWPLPQITAAFAPETPDNALLTLAVAQDVEIAEARLTLAGAPHTANLAGTAVPTGTLVTLEFSALRPCTRIGFVKADAAAPSTLMVQLGGVWHQPAAAGGVDFANVQPGAAFPELVAEKALLSNVASVSNVESTSYPANVTLRLGDGGVPFFFHRGELRGEVWVPDFSQHLALALQGIEPVGGVRSVDLVAHSDAFGIITATAARLVGRMAHDSLQGLSDAERTVAIPAGGTASFNMPAPQGLAPPQDRPAVTGASVAFTALAFGPAFPAPAGRRGAIVSAQFQVAQAVDFPAKLTASGVHLYLLRRTPQAALTLELRADGGGEPRGTILATASFQADGLPDGAFDWATVALEKPLALEAGARLWIVLKADQGEVEWRGDDVADSMPAARFSADRGNTWQPHSLAVSYIFERLLPDPAAPLAITLKVGDERQEIPYQPETFPAVLDASSPLVRGLNAVIAAQTGGELDAPLPLEIAVAMVADPPPPVQIVLTRLDVTYTFEVVLEPGS